MIVGRDYPRRPSDVVLRMPLAEFREFVEWLESLDPQNGVTRDLRADLNELDPTQD